MSRLRGRVVWKKESVLCMRAYKHVHFSVISYQRPLNASPYRRPHTYLYSNKHLCIGRVFHKHILSTFLNSIPISIFLYICVLYICFYMEHTFSIAQRERVQNTTDKRNSCQSCELAREMLKICVYGRNAIPRLNRHRVIYVVE